jgi:hypothetical protein
MAGSGVPDEGGAVIELRRSDRARATRPLPERPPHGLLRGARRYAPDRLDDRMCEFIARQHMMFVAGSGYGGVLRSGPPGFVRVVDRHRLAWLEDRRDELLGQLGQAAGIDLLFVDLFQDMLSLRVYGRITPVPCPPELLTGTARWLGVRVEAAHVQPVAPLRTARLPRAASRRRRLLP